MSSRIAEVRGALALDSRGSPTVKARVVTEGGAVGTAIAPSGASKSVKEAVELRDGGTRWAGRGVGIAIANINEVIAPRLKGIDAREQRFIDRAMIALDGTPDKSRLGGNAIVAVSLAVAKAAAAQLNVPLYSYLGGVRSRVLPTPFMNVINGGAHAGNELSFQEFMIVPVGADAFSEALRIAVEVYYVLKAYLKEKYGKGAVNVGDEGGFAPPMRRNEEALEALMQSIKRAGYSESHVLLGIDAAASQFYSNGSYLVDGRELSAGELRDLYLEVLSRYPIVYLEDPYEEGDFASFAELTSRVKRALIVGDDLYSTNLKYLRRGLEVRATNAALLKVNQAGTLSESIDFYELARGSGLRVVVSHRSGDSEDSFIADLAVALGSPIKTGAPARGERTAKYNRLLEIEEELGGTAEYLGSNFV
ncbi:MAG: phosphopyruvate hydratase [Acidilobaceae archaeon]|nr:phosphopyruvate hydratase [Acidilobaceae archaeon]